MIMMTYFWAFAYIIFELFDKPFVSIRGIANIILDKIIIAIAIFIFSVLLFYVVDSTCICVRFVRQLMYVKGYRLQRDWLQENQKLLGLYIHNFDCAYYWFRIRLIADRTEAINKLINYPFVIVLLIIFSCNTFFDNLFIPPSIYIFLIICVLIPVICGYNLRKVANDAKNKTLKLLNNEVVRVTGGISPGYKTSNSRRSCVDQINLIISDVQGIRKGAFVQLHQQPFVKSILYLLGIIGFVISQYYSSNY